MKLVCQTLGVARSNVHQRARRAPDWVDGRRAARRDLQADLDLVAAIHAEIVELPTYGYRRAGALVNRTRTLIFLLCDGRCVQVRPSNHGHFKAAADAAVW